jgi:hypothetical protein
MENGESDEISNSNGDRIVRRYGHVCYSGRIRRCRRSVGKQRDSDDNDGARPFVRHSTSSLTSS